MILAEKRILRQQTKKTLLLCEPWESLFHRERLKDHLELVLSRHHAVTYWGAFQSLRDEPVIELKKLKTQRLWCYPKMDSSGEGLSYFYGGGFLKNPKLGFLEPDSTSQPIKPEQMSGILIPGLAFDKRGFRLGRGRGFYDRFLANFKGLKIGVCSSLQMHEWIPAQKHDVQMDAIVTEKTVYWIR